MTSFLDHNNFKRFKKAKADEIASMVPHEYLRPKDKPTRMFLDNEYVTGGYLDKLPRTCSIVYMAILFHCNTETQAAFPSIITIQKHIGEKNPNTVATAIQILEWYGIIMVLRNTGRFGRSSLYIFQDVRYWKAVDKSKARIKIKSWQERAYQKTAGEGINSADSAAPIDTLTNLNKNYPKELTNRMRSLSDQMNINKKPDKPRQGFYELAIREGSTHSVVRSAYEGRKDAPVANATQMQREDINNDINLPVTTGNLQAEAPINIDTIVPVNTGKLRDADDINVDTIEPFINGEKRGDEPFKKGEKGTNENNDLSPGNIRNEDLSAGTAS